MPSKNRSKVPIGTVLEGKFRITQEIGRGGMAAVYEAENVDIGKRVAVKLLAAELITSRVVRERFIREARATARIRSPYICDVYDSGMFEERPFLVMELLEGESLYDMMTRVRRIDAQTTLKICTHVARGLEKAHESNIVHRDLKPENIFLTKGEDEKLIAKILDFGLAKFYEPTGGDEKNVRLTREGALFGTPAYMSPEQAKGQGQVDHRADLWALGCIVYECLTGQTVWNVEQGVAMILAQIAGAPIPVPSKLRPDLPAGFDSWFARALNRDPGQRYQSAPEFADSLARALDPSSKAPVSIAETELEPPSSPVHPEINLDLGNESENAAVGVAGPDTDRMPREGSRSNGAFAWLVALAAVTLAGYGVWLYVLHPPGKLSGATQTGESGESTEEETEQEKQVVPAEIEPYALQIGSGQKWLSQGNQDNALKMFKEGFKSGGSEVARGLSLQIGAVIESPEGPCKLTGLGRPRPFTIVSAASRPTLALTDDGLVFGWVDNHDEKNKKQGYTTLLDDLLRRIAPARMVTPEAITARYVQLVPVQQRLAMVYWEGGGPEPGVYTRMLKSDGRMEEAPQRISEVSRSQFYPSLTELADGSFVAIWTRNFKKGVANVMARRLGTDLKPQSKVIQLTDFVPERGMETLAGKADAAVVDNHLFIVFELENKRHASIKLLKLKVDSPDLGQGLSEKPDGEQTRHVGQLIDVSSEEGKHGQPRISCVKEGCFVVWDNEGAGATASFVNGETGEPIWHRDFAPKGARPGLGRREDGETLLVWYESGRVRLTPLNRDGIGDSSVLGRVSGYQPYPAVVAGKQPGEWYVSWRGFEAGHLEAFVARTLCTTQKQ